MASCEKSLSVEDRLNQLLSGQPWATAPMFNSWTGTLSYRLSMDQRSVQLRTSGLTPGTTANTTKIASVPAGFRPMANAVIPASCDVMGAESPHITVMASGDIECFGVASSTFFAVEGSYALDV